jgi:hypothetical protein
MIQLALILLGGDYVKRQWPWLAGIGLVWALLGVAIFVDALDGVIYFPLHLFGYLLLIEAVATLCMTSPVADAASLLRKFRGVAFLVLGLLMVDAHHAANVILAMAFGLAFLVDGGFRIAAAVVVRFQGWLLSLLTGLFEVAFAAFMFEPYPTFYHGTIPYCIGMGLFLSGVGLLRRAVRLARRPERISIAALQSKDLPDAPPPAVRTTDLTQAAGLLVVHVWTPIGSAGETIPHPLVDRYIAAVDTNGVVSTGHAALECTPDIYVSHYPAVEIDRSSASFARALRATADNNVAGKFQPSYEVEAAEWCDSTTHVVFDRFDRARLATFWEIYRQDTTYNLTNRNCSSSVANCLDAALEGSLGAHGAGLAPFFRAIFNPELWFAAQLRKRAEAMAWTPGLVLDYARALRAAITPSPLGWKSLWSAMQRSWRYGVAVFGARASRQVKAARGKAGVGAQQKDGR